MLNAEAAPVRPPLARRHLALLGPTASGKSALALELARRLGDLELVAIDSMQVYRGMDVGTAKPTPAERAEVPHHLIDLVDPSEEWSLAGFQRAALDAVAAIEARGNRALLVGGTGLYLRAVVDRLDIPGQWPSLRATLEAEPDTAALHEQLGRVDPASAARVEPANRRRVVRALEVSLGSGRPFSSYGPGLEAHPPTPFDLVGVWLPRPVVSTRIEARVQAMVAGGLLDEVRALAHAEHSVSRTAAQALGYRQLFEHLAGEVSLDDALDRTVRSTRAFARRQRMWFRRDPRTTWFGAPVNPLALLSALARRWG